MEVFRLAREKYKQELSGKGAAAKGARWNSVDVEIIYTAANKSLAMAEVAVHISLGTLASDYYMLTIYIPESISLLKLKSENLPGNWNVFPPSSTTQRIGDEFVRNAEYCLLQVPSVVTEGDYNYLINPNHPDFSKISIIDESKFGFDKRLFSGDKRYITKGYKKRK